MAAARGPNAATSVRADRLADVADSGQDELVRSALAALWDEHKPAFVRVREALVWRESPDLEAPPAARLRAPNGQALRFYLTCLFVAACQQRGTHPAEFRNRYKIERDSDGRDPGWVDLMAIASRADAVKERAPRRVNRVRQVKTALDRLEALSLVSLGAEGRAKRYDNFELHPEHGSGGYANPTRYKIPTAGFTIPAAFFLNGWLWALSNSEIAAYLMFRHLAWTYTGAHTGGGIYVSGQKREDEYDLTRDAYEAHLLLAQFGLLEMHPAPGRGVGGGWSPKSGHGRMPHKFTVIDAGCQRSAITTVVRAL